ncbi:MAG: hypothetical protein HY885_08230 [Deltaproteobacteria bacterium]|nr:hypothetical protein [Deltaproteobacteria bacterium]
MSKKLLTVALAVAFIASTATVSMAAKIKCTVDTVEGNKVTMTCEGAGDLKAGDKVEVKSGKGGKAVEGC